MSGRWAGRARLVCELGLERHGPAGTCSGGLGAALELLWLRVELAPFHDRTGPPLV